MKLRKYRPEYRQELFRLADADFFSADLLLSGGARIENACFYFQQTVEKALKAALVHLEIEFPSVHDHAVLLALLPNTEPSCPFQHELSELNIYAAQRRYEEGPAPATVEDAKSARNMAEAVLRWSKDL